MSEAVRAHVEPDVCIGSGMCEATAPDLFEVTDEGTSRVLVDPVPPERVEAARQAAADCPTRALTLEDS
jgi:ferredoxin